ncbi:AI-2E family transporter [Paenibacillus filicis]|uniref:AI-2E family transporter n=1 Tax=Paenibacillus filicis TaxID=669464 RepID=A0ABU9DJ68_9BACL
MNFKSIVQHKDVQRFAVLLLLCLLLYVMRSMLNLLLLTFLFTFLIHQMHQYALRKLPVNSKLLLALIYLLLVGGVGFAGVKFLPELASQIGQLVVLIEDVYKHPQNELMNYAASWLGSLDLPSLVKPGFDFVMKLGHLGLQGFLALLLSFFLLLSKESVVRFTAQFHTSKLGWFSREVEILGYKLTRTFGKVIEAQLMIAFVNCVLTTIFLWVMGFPNLIGLALLIFVLGLIPVAGVIVSLIPLGLIAFSLGGLPYVVYLLIAILVIHALEAYILNPRLMASKTHLPMFYTCLVLLFGEHFFGIWGLIVGIPTFVFLLDILEVQTIGEPQVIDRKGA